MHWADIVHASLFSHGGARGRPGVAGRSRRKRADPSVAAGGRDCQLSRDLCTSQERQLQKQLERALCAPPKPGEEREPGGRRAGGAGYVNDTSPVRGLQAVATGGGGTTRGGGAGRERAGVGGGRGAK